MDNTREEFQNEIQSTDEVVTQSAKDEIIENGVPAPQADVDSKSENVKKKRELPAGLKKISDYLNAHENLRQMVFFLLFSFVCFAIEYLTYTILALCLKTVNTPINWFVFKYDTAGGGLGAFIAFLISNVIAQICTFVLNRKKTFNATNNVVISGIMYAVIVILIIILNTYLGGVITDAIARSSDNNPAMVTFGGYVGKFVGSFMSFVINFLGCKFLVMRDWGKKKSKNESEESEQPASPETAIPEGKSAETECVAAEYRETLSEPTQDGAVTEPEILSEAAADKNQ